MFGGAPWATRADVGDARRRAMGNARRRAMARCPTGAVAVFRWVLQGAVIRLISVGSALPVHLRKPAMPARHTLAAIVTAVAALALLPGCAVTRNQSTVGTYIDDTALTTAVKARFIDSTQVDAAAISVETLEGTVMLSGFAKSQTEKSMAESIARATKGVKAVKNQLAVRN